MSVVCEFELLSTELPLTGVAAALETTTSALSERLRRGQRRLVGHTVASAE
ncbi:hypothetical protein [Halapricum desulfuricans]|nr:hypothetical protein [Halapricum desulfuricans]